MAGWILALLEWTALLLAAWALADAWRRGGERVVELLAGAVFGLLVEQLAILLGQMTGAPTTYRYGAFFWMLTPDVPLAVAAGWGALLYSAIKYSDGLGIPIWVRPWVDGLYVMMIDLTMDVVAVHLGLWHWNLPPERQWFGVPYANYAGWLLVGAIFSGAVRLVRALVPVRPAGRPAAGRWALRTGCLTCGVVAGAWSTVWVLARLFDGTDRDLWPAGLLALLAVGMLLYGLRWRRTATVAQVRAARSLAGSSGPWPDPALAQPPVWHAVYLAAALLSGVFAGRMALLFLTGVLAAVGTLLVAGLAPGLPSDGVAE